MYNEIEEVFEEADLDTNTQKREDLIEKAKSINPDASWNEISKQIASLRKQWKKIPYWESFSDDQLAEEFESVLNQYYARRDEFNAKSVAAKEEIIKEAKALVNGPIDKKSSDKMNELMTQWKAIGYTVKEKDDELWEQFSAQRKAYFEKKHQSWQDLQEKFANAHDVKANIVEQAQAICESENFKETDAKFKELLDQWKLAGYSGKKDEELWEEFSKARKVFYDRQRKHYDELHATQKANAAAKKDLIQQAKDLLDKQEFNRDVTNKMKALGAQWKEIGSCGKEKEDQLWNAFRSTLDEYFDSLKEINQSKHEEWVDRMEQKKAYKQDLINRQQNQISRLKTDMITMISESQVEDAQASIEDKEAFIKQLEAEIADIDKQLKD